MADRDFAKLQATVKPETEGASGLRVSMLVVGILLMVIMSFVGGYWLGGQKSHESAETAAKTNKLLAQLQEQQKELKALRKQANKAKAAIDNAPTMDMGDLTFYTDLPKQPVKPEPLSQPAPSSDTPSPVTALAPSSSSAPSVKPDANTVLSTVQKKVDNKLASGAGLFYVQAASFRDMNAVSDMLHKLQAMNLNTVVRRVNIPSKGIWYRLLVGPYTTRNTAESARINLVNKMHLKGIVIRGGG